MLVHISCLHHHKCWSICHDFIISNRASAENFFSQNSAKIWQSPLKNNPKFWKILSNWSLVTPLIGKIAATSPAAQHKDLRTALLGSTADLTLEHMGLNLSQKLSCHKSSRKKLSFHKSSMGGGLLTKGQLAGGRILASFLCHYWNMPKPESFQIVGAQRRLWS